jgi:predicted AAA+ superfamily ATPase
MFQRQTLQTLRKWRAEERRKPLIIRGARQVGKTTLVRQFGVEYKTYAELNLDLPADRVLFDLESVEQVISNLELARGIRFDPGETLLFIDEIQASPKAIHLLRYFYEIRPDIHVIAAGSLLEFAFRHVKSMPVGRVTFMYLGPLNFPEFLGAIGNPKAQEVLDRVPFQPELHEVMLRFFHQYAMLGGMPEVVASYAPGNSTAAVPGIMRNIWASYLTDAEKYARNPTEQKVLAHVLATAPQHLERIALANFGNSNYRSREVGEAFFALGKAGIIRTVYPSTSIEPPIAPDRRKRPRLQFLDTGLLNHMAGTQAEIIGVKDMAGVRQGRIIEHLVVQELISMNSYSADPPCFWVREERSGNAELDALVAHGPHVIPIEVKTGAQGSLKSLHEFVDRAPHPYAVRFYAGNLSVERHTTPKGTPYILLNLPYFLATRLPEYLDWLKSEHPI